MSIAEKIYETVKALPERQAAEILTIVEELKAKLEAEDRERREQALATLTKYRGRFKAEKFDREGCYDRPGFR
jgi:hypothetical protein